MIIGIDASKSAVGKRTGVENTVYQLVLALSNSDQKNIYNLYTNAHLPKELIQNKNFVEKFIPPHRFWNMLYLSRALLRDKPERYLQPAHFIPLFAPRKSVAIVHDLAWLKYPASYSFKQRLIQWLTLGNICHKATKLICVSDSTKNDLIAYKPSTKNKAVVVHLAAGNFEPKARPKDILNLKSDYFLAGGRLDYRKNIINVVKAFYQAKEQGIKEKLVLIGEPGWGYEEIMKEIDIRPEFKHSVVMPGFMTPDQLRDLIPGATAFVFPSQYEGFGIPVLDAMQAGTPVITSNISSLPEVAGEAAVLVDPNNSSQIAESMLEIIHNQALRADLINKGRIQANKFSWTKTAEQVQKILEEL